MHDQSSSEASEGRPARRSAGGRTEAARQPNQADASSGSPNGKSPPRNLERDPVAVALGRRGGLKGGRARAEQLSPEQRRAIAQRAAHARWGTKLAAPLSTEADTRPATPEARPAWVRPSVRDTSFGEESLTPGHGSIGEWPSEDLTSPRTPRSNGQDFEDPLERAAEAVGRSPVQEGRQRSDALPGSESPQHIQLADWRRRIFDLYAEVRRIARDDPQRAWNQWRGVREDLYRRHPLSPMSEGQRESFHATHYPYDAGLRFELPVRPDPFGRGQEVGGPSSAVFLPNSGPEMLSFDRVGWIEVPLPSGSVRLSVFWLTTYGGGLFLPFRDGTNGSDTYGAGRYVLDTAKGADLGSGAQPGSLVVDFNFAFQPSCAFDPKWACPLAPPENRLEQPIRAGERL
jgi:uncharacterized protein (DUF1684 family)